MTVGSQNTSWTRRVVRSSREEASAAASVLLLLPLAAFIIIFWAVYQQMSTNFILQACQMDLRVGSGQITPAQMNLLDSGVIIAMVPVFDAFIYPAIGRWRGKIPTPLEKMAVGFMFGVLSMVCAGIVEIFRKQAPIVFGSFSNCEGSPAMNGLSVFYQVPQYMLIGIAEILISIPAYDLFYAEVPVAMRSVCQAVNLLTTSFGGFVAAGITNIFSSWLPDNLNLGHMEYVYFFLGGLCLINTGLYVYTINKGYGGNGYVYKADRIDNMLLNAADE